MADLQRCGRWPVADVLTVTATKRSLARVASAGPNGRRTRWCGRRPRVIWKANHHRPLRRYLDWRYLLFPSSPGGRVLQVDMSSPARVVSKTGICNWSSVFRPVGHNGPSICSGVRVHAGH